tara:strand:- start:7188 stop:7403 length:216 start_codon:yes stop_codon:yes gene_type:complete
MKIKIVKKTFIGSGGNLWPGSEIDVDDQIGTRLIDSGIAESLVKKQTKKSKPKKLSNKKHPKLSKPSIDLG